MAHSQADEARCLPIQITVVSEIFEGLRPVARQQKVYAPLNEFIRSGELHAVNIIAKTP